MVAVVVLTAVVTSFVMDVFYAMPDWLAPIWDSVVWGS
ncbi:hypothetical protein Rrhod_2454 [Rhodococcus rhodnii LMG 5362]|uniref:Uncharacterized protein n=1 Tax=Rhodococcus rhodnii LMG 5362 TaxID=1273125 RepID=R7WLA8_9NOCA|nr:hypothetical protein Rrhod_2454 [Rhodococcus rhodnii LMG 5362]